MMDGIIPGGILGLVLRSLLLPSVVSNKPKSLRTAIAQWSLPHNSRSRFVVVKAKTEPAPQ